MWSESAEELVFLTGLVESKYKYIKQIGTGPARSFWQVEPSTARDSIDNYLKYREKRLGSIANIMRISPEDLLDMSEHELGIALWSDMVAGIVFCRLKYWRVPHKIPSSTIGLARYWKKWYNTDGGAGTVSHFIEIVKGRKDLPV